MQPIKIVANPYFMRSSPEDNLPKAIMQGLNSKNISFYDEGERDLGYPYGKRWNFGFAGGRIKMTRHYDKKELKYVMLTLLWITALVIANFIAVIQIENCKISRT